MRKMTELDKKYILTLLEHIVRWQLESVQNIKENYLNIQPAMFEITNIHDLSVFIKANKIDIEPEEWEHLYIVASDKARTKFLEDKD